MKSVGYIRVSSDMQVETGHSLDAQRAFITDYAHTKGWTLVDIFCDPGLSGSLGNRPALQELMERATRGEFEVVIVHAIDRFYRDLSGLLAALHYLHQHHVTFVSITENLDFTTPWGKLVLAVLGALAEIYIDRLREETKKGKQARARKGLWNGSIPFGYCNGLCAACTDVNGKDYCPNFGQANQGDGKCLIAHPVESLAVRLSYDWYETGLFSHGLVASKLNAFELILPDGTKQHFRTKRWLSRGGPHPFTRDSVREILSRPFYTGQLPYYGKNGRGMRLKRNAVTFWAEGKHPALISRELYERCQQVHQLLGSRPRTNGVRQRRAYPLSGSLYCAQCGRRMMGFYHRGERRYYCATPLGHDGLCDQPSVSAESVETQVVQFLMQIKWPSDWQKEFRSQANRDEAISREEKQMLQELEQVANFATNWRAAHNLIEQKSLLRIAMTRLTLRENSLVEIQLSRGLSQWLMTHYQLKKTEETPGEPVYQLVHSDSQVNIKLTQEAVSRP